MSAAPTSAVHSYVDTAAATDTAAGAATVAGVPLHKRWFNWRLLFTPFFIIHLICFAAIFTGVSVVDLAICFVLYYVRMFGVTAGYHRYFSHRTYKMSRPMQFLMAFLAQSSAQKGALWWAAHHRHHHKHSDQPDDVHSPEQHGFWYAHVGWMLTKESEATDMSKVKDLAKYPELVWLNKYFLLPAILLGVAVWWIAGWSGLVVGFFWSTVLLWHGTFTINSLAHVIGKKRYPTTDDSRNHLGLALVTMGEGWHNNHHYYQSSANQGFFWWEIDLSYYILKMMSWVGLVWDLKTPPKHVIENRPHPAAVARLEQTAIAVPDNTGDTMAPEPAPAPTFVDTVTANASATLLPKLVNPLNAAPRAS